MASKSMMATTTPDAHDVGQRNGKSLGPTTPHPHDVTWAGAMRGWSVI